jgi:hypothetical protein
MSQKEGVRLVVIVEDKSLERFARKTLKAFGFDSHRVRILPDFPRGGAGSGKRYVEQMIEKEVVTFRQKSRENTGLLLGTEADQQSVEERTRVLDTHIAQANRPARGSAERIVYWIPKWHVETWGLHLTGIQVNEDENYKNEARNVDWKAAAEAFVQEYRRAKDGPIDTLNSLKAAYRETQRLAL